MLATAADLRGVAEALRSTLSHVEGDRSSLQRAGRIFQTWRSPAADELRDTLYPMCVNSLGFVTRDLADLAALLDHAANAMDDQLRSIRSIETNARHWFSTQPAPADGSQPRWVAEWWKYRPGRLPVTGDSEWLEVGPYLRSRGVWI